MLPNRYALFLASLVTVLLQSCAGSNATLQTDDCRSLSGRYRDAGVPINNSLMQFLLKKKTPDGAVVKLDVDAERIRVSSGAIAAILAAKTDFECSSIGRVVLTRQESSRISLPPLIHQTRTVTYMLTGGAGADLTLRAYVQTTVIPFGTKLEGPRQLEATTTWHRTGP